MSKKSRSKNKITLRDGRLATHPPINPPDIAKKAVLADDKDYVNTEQKGRKSLIEMLKVNGVYIRVLAKTRTFRIENPDSSYKDLYLYLQKIYPYIFTNDNVYGSNFKKIVDSDEKWSSAFFSCQGDIDEMIDLQTSMLVQRDDLKEETIVKLYDIQLKKKQYEQENLLNSIDNDGNINVNINITGGEC